MAAQSLHSLRLNAAVQRRTPPRRLPPWQRLLPASRSGLIIGVVLAYVGYRFTWAEFRRDQRIRVYGDFGAAFLWFAHIGAAGLAAYNEHLDELFGDECRPLRAALMEDYKSSYLSYETALVRVGLVASENASEAADNMDDFISANVRAVPPFRTPPTGAEPKALSAQWGAAARSGAGAIESKARELAVAFETASSGDIVQSREDWWPRWLRRRANTTTAADR